jgi:ribose-phosphate pyrophosphokinase
VILFASEALESMASAIREGSGTVRAGRCQVTSFENGELRAFLETPVAGQDCLILGTIAPPGERMLSTLLLISTLKKERARTVTAVLPYLAYTRQDKDKPGQSMATSWSGALLAASGCDRIITVDIHSQRAVQLLSIPVTSISPAAVFATVLQQCGLAGSTLVAPDEGAIVRCDAVRAAGGLPPSKTPYFAKQRTEAGIAHADLTGETGRRVVIIDDILDTGTTLVSACEKLVRAGVEDIEIMVTHGLFTGARWHKLWQFGAKRIFCTDTIPVATEDRRIIEVSVAPLLAKAIHDL